MAPTKDIALSVAGLTKKYRDVTAVNNLTFEVNRGEIFGFLGPNGAGKTTTIQMMSGLLEPDSGIITINDTRLYQKSRMVKSSIGFCPQNITIWDNLTCLEQLEFIGEMYDLPARVARKKGLELLEVFGLIEKRGALAKNLSGGMQRRLNIALALVHQPQILILDEPQAGLDPQSRVLVRDYIRSLRRKTTVILTTHDMDEAERLADRVAIVDHGVLLVLDTPEHLIKEIGMNEVLEVVTAASQTNQAIGLLSKLPNIRIKETSDELIWITHPAVVRILPEVADLLKINGVEVTDLKIRKTTLEDVFISLTGRGLRE